jgi:hypothetical protein
LLTTDQRVVTVIAIAIIASPGRVSFAQLVIGTNHRHNATAATAATTATTATAAATVLPPVGLAGHCYIVIILITVRHRDGHSAAQ